MAENNEDLFHVISMNDENAKIIAMELANDKGRMVLESIFEGKKSSSEVAKELNMSLPTVLFHIERLKDTGVIKVIETNLSKKFREIKYYGPTKKAILIIPSKNKEPIESAANSIFTGINAKLVGITGFIGAMLSGGMIKLFSNKSLPVENWDNEILTAPPIEDAVLEGSRQGIDAAVQTLPSTGTIIAIVLAATVLAMSIAFMYQKVRKKGFSGRDTIF